MEKMRTAVIGLGVMGRQHLRIYKEMEGVELVAVHDINESYARQVGEEYGVQAVSSAEQLFAMEELDAVSICTSDEHHYALAKLACKYGKHVLMEKPLATDIGQASDIVRMVRDSGIVMMVGHTLRWDPRYYRAYEAVRAGSIGAPLHLFARRLNSYANGKRIQGRTGVLMFLGVHDIDAIEWVTGDRIVEVYTVEVSNRLKEYGTSDASLSTLKFASGAVGLYECGWVLPDHYSEIDAKLDIVGTAGVVNVHVLDQNIKVHTDTREHYPDTAYGVELYGRISGIMREELASFAQAVRSGAKLPISVEEAYRAVYIADCMERSAREGKPVSIGSELP
ncbi:Gfo/Idh/MocA family protein [Paenibacillus nasutitermitis]|uniref:Dehydrogenase n=1 Tax=Paenibacillus nasutitermitis TaxID=1652958 RepID=A0A916YQ78_9BACL|nr:Gfo/Idh/MocA family oxidoreductase [Paenibacillus nasutitermitis]GGD56128.1 dehydrogenase [Paenibacillus nasutitermitis]